MLVWRDEDDDDETTRRPVRMRLLASQRPPSPGSLDGAGTHLSCVRLCFQPALLGRPPRATWRRRVPWRPPRSAACRRGAFMAGVALQVRACRADCFRRVLHPQDHQVKPQPPTSVPSPALRRLVPSPAPGGAPRQRRGEQASCRSQRRVPCRVQRQAAPCRVQRHRHDDSKHHPTSPAACTSCYGQTTRPLVQTLMRHFLGPTRVGHMACRPSVVLL